MSCNNKKLIYAKVLAETDLNIKKHDFEHLLFNVNAAERILQFGEFVEKIIK